MSPPGLAGAAPAAPVRLPVGSVRVAGRFGAWRALVVLPAVVGGMAVMLVLTAGLGGWQAPALLAWLSVPVLTSARLGERAAVRLVFRFRRLTQRELGVLEPVLQATLARCGLAPQAVDWRVQPGRQRSACAAGRRTVAVTEGALRDFLAGRLPGDLFAAVLVHELGHHATRASRLGLATGWLALPGRLAFRLVLALAALAGGARRLGPATALVAGAGGAVAVVQAVQRGQWLSAGILSAVAASLVLTPVLDAVISRASEHAADRYAASVGAGPDLARALTVLGGTGSRRTFGERLVDRHPAVADRVARLSDGRPAGRRRTGPHAERSAVPVGVLPTRRRPTSWWAPRG